MANSISLPKKVNYKIKQGDTFKRALTHEVNGEPEDMSGVVPVFIFQSDTIDNLTLGDGLEWGGDNNEVLYIYKNISWAGTYNYELQYSYPGGEVQTKTYGKVTSVTQIDED